jgi:hypothetical protein
MTTPQAPAHNPHQASTRQYLVGERFAGILAEDFGIACDVILATLEGEPQRQAIRILSWAERTADPTYALSCWARRHGRGSYRVLGEGPPSGSVDRGDRRQGYGGYRPASCSLRAVVVDTDVLNRIAHHLGLA